ncbi:MAG: hypothetical protein IJJ29_04170 [Solobacterium sp.]|nr:hypothetical protein [Solobacterium sp.]
MNWMKTRFLVYGALLGSAGVKILTSDDAKKVYTHITAAVMRGRNEIARTYTSLRENCEDIGADAKAINEKRAEQKEAAMIEDAKEILAAAKEKGKK